MSEREFCHWLQGCIEMGAADGGLSAAQVEIIRERLSAVFNIECVAPEVTGVYRQPVGSGGVAHPMIPRVGGPH